MTVLLLAIGIGFVSGLRVMTPLAALAIVHRSTIGAIVLSIAAIGEYVTDLMPKMGARTEPPQLVARCVSGAIGGWFITSWHGGSPVVGAILGVIGAVIGTYGGYAARVAAIARIGAIPAGVTEDVIAIALAALIVTR